MGNMEISVMNESKRNRINKKECDEDRVPLL